MAGAEILFHRQHLTHSDAMVAEKLIIPVDQLSLTYGGVELTLIHGVHLAVNHAFQLAAP